MSRERKLSEEQGLNVACPSCGLQDMVGRLRSITECVDLPTGEVVARADPKWTNDFECGRCGHYWTMMFEQRLSASAVEGTGTERKS